MITTFRSRWLLALVLALVVCSIAPAYAQAPAVTMAVAAGYEGAYRVDEWFPIRVVVANNGADLKGRLEWRFTNDNGSRFVQEVDLPNGAQKQVTLYVTTSNFSRSGELTLVANNAEQAKQQVQLEELSSDQLLVAVASSDPALLNSLNSFTTPNFNTASVRHIDLATLPEQAQALQSVNILFIHDRDSTTLTAQQRSALSAWVDQGGQLVIGGGSNAAQTVAGLQELLPVELGDVQQASLTPLANGGSDLAGLPTTATVNTATLRPQATALFNQQPALVVRQQRGNGSVTFAAFDLSVLRGWRGEPGLWESAITPTTIQSIGSQARQQRLNLLDDVLELGALSLIPASILVALIALYVLAIGPINYLVLRRFKRLEWAWLSIPLIVFGFVGGIYGAGRLIRGGSAQLAQIAIVQVVEGSNQSTTTAYNGLFSPDRARYSFRFAPGTLVQELRSFDDFGAAGNQVVISDTGSEVRDSLVDIGAIRTILSESSNTTDISIESKLNESGTLLRGDMRYNGNSALTDAVLVRGEAYQSLGTLQPGTTVAVDIKTDQSGFPWSLTLDEQNLINREAMLNRLSSVGSNTGLLDQNTVYLLGWRNEPRVAVQINGQPSLPKGVTLYIVQLHR